MIKYSISIKKVFVFIFAFVIQLTFAQVTTNLGDFKSVKVFDKLTVKLISSNENKAVINGSRAGDVIFINKNGELKIRMPLQKLLTGDAIFIELYFVDINEIEAYEGAVVSSESTFKAVIMDVSAREGAKVNLRIEGTEKVNIKVVTGGFVELSGNVVNQDVVIMSGGILNAKNLETVQTSINVSAGGNAEIKASLLVDAKVRAGGSITIYGKPKQINKETVFGGKITEKN